MEKQIELDTIRNRLHKESKVLDTRIKVEKERASPNSLANPDRSDLANDYAYRARRLSMLEQLEDQLEEIKKAIQRMENGTYGQCTNCGEPILPERLDALPSAPLCINCQRRTNAN
jgi:RNA polymerase-binding protein DksA